MTELILVRHAESTWNLTGRYQGRIDTELSPLGEKQAALVAQRLRALPVTAVYSSPLRRAFHTAVNIALQHGLEVQIQEGLTEIDHGAWQGLLKEEVEKRFGPLLQIWQTAPSRVTMPGGESLGDVQKRGVAALAQIGAVHPEGTVVVCSHDAVIKAVLAHYLGMSLDDFWRLELENTSLTRLSFGEGRFRLVSLNDACHLGSHRSATEGQAL